MGKKKGGMTHLSEFNRKVDITGQFGETRNFMEEMFKVKLQRLIDELMAKPDCPQKFWVLYTVKYDDINRKIKEMWQVTDQKPDIKLGQIRCEFDKSGHVEIDALPFDIPVPDSVLSDNIVLDNFDKIKDIPLSGQFFQKVV